MADDQNTPQGPDLRIVSRDGRNSTYRQVPAEQPDAAPLVEQTLGQPAEDKPTTTKKKVKDA